MWCVISMYSWKYGVPAATEGEGKGRVAFAKISSVDNKASGSQSRRGLHDSPSAIEHEGIPAITALQTLPLIVASHLIMNLRSFTYTIHCSPIPPFPHSLFTFAFSYHV